MNGKNIEVIVVDKEKVLFLKEEEIQGLIERMQTNEMEIE
jgi:hypothetical protein